jgi:ATP synthase protein I
MQKWQSALVLLEVGWFVGIAMVAGVLGGMWLDDRLGTQPLFVIIGLFLGLATAVAGAARMLSPLMKNGNGKGKID